MELQVKEYELPSAITFNYEELKSSLMEKCHTYETMVYTDDDIKAAKSDRASLNKLKQALNNERIRREREYMVPFNEFKDKINEIISIIDKPAALIDARVKEFEQKKKEEKREQIVALFADAGLPEYITLEKVWDESWLNSSVSLARIKECLKDIAFRDEQAMQTIQNLPEFPFEAAEYYKKSLDLTAAIAKASEHAQMEKAKKAAEEEAARRAAEEKKAIEVVDEIPFSDPVQDIEVVDNTPAEEPRVWLSFKAFLSFSEAKELSAFFKHNNITFEQIKEG